MDIEVDQQGEAYDFSLGRILALTAFGAVVLSVFDAFHTHSGTTRYTTTVVWEAAWWTPLIFGLATGVGGPLYVLAYRRLGGRRAPPGWWSLVPGVVLFGALYYFSGFYQGANATKLGVLSAAAIGLHGWLDRTRAGIVVLLLTAAVGPLIESFLVHAGVFLHLHPDLLHVPMWLPALYACGAVVLGQGTRRWLRDSRQDARS
jgi:hypothetical protein